MLFSSFTFILIFLPIVLFLYYINKKRNYRNIILLISSLIFYAWGEPKYILLMISLIIINYYLVILMEKFSRHKKHILIITIILNLLFLIFFKYLNFSIITINNLFNIKIPLTNIVLPIGISFYTFQILSYVIDVYKKKVKVQKNIIALGTYISLFPQLIAGPIIQYDTIENELTNRKENLELFTKGLRRFFLGLGKKVIIANNMALIADTIYNGNLKDTGTFMLWLAAIAYTLQIYYDFSGYSDMAIGLGKMFGFNFLENFNYPYIAKSITDFWRRWHISLSLWFRDYLYIPLGGNRVSQIKWIRNILIVWSLTGLWHGASWNFVLWGLYFAFFLILEKKLLEKFIKKCPKFIYWIIVMFIVVISWVIFRLENFNDLLQALNHMFIYTQTDFNLELFNNLDLTIACCFIIPALIGASPILKNICNKYIEKSSFFCSLSYLYAIIIYLLSIALLLNNTYNPFIYFRF